MSYDHPSWTLGGWRDRGEGGPWRLEPGDDPGVGVLERPVLVTAFGPFPGQPVNPSELVVDELAGEEDVVGHVLDASYERAPDQLDAMVRMVDPPAVVCFAVAKAATTVRLELRAAATTTSDAPDVDGVVRRGHRIDSGPATMPTRLDVDGVRGSLAAAGIPVDLSEDAGGSVGNRVFRHALTHIDLLDRPVGLVHVPRLGAPGFDAARFGQVGRLVVAAVVRSLVRAEAA